MHIPLDRLTVPPRRQRTAMDATKLMDLMRSIEEKGLLHPIVVRELPGDTGPIYQLVCGGRRLTAVRRLFENKQAPRDCPLGEIPATLLGDLSSLEREEAELEENILREDLSWQDKSAAIAKLHEIRTALNPEQTVRDTAVELAHVQERSIEGARKDVARAIVVQKALEAGDQRVAGARSQREAYDLISKSLEADFTAALAKATGGKTSHQLHVGDCIPILAGWPAASFDCIIADPPYGIDADKFGDAGQGHEYDDSPELAIGLNTTILEEGFRVTKPSAHLYLFCDPDWFRYYRDEATKYGWSVQRTPIIWYKGQGRGHDPHPGIGFRRTYEMILFCWKGQRPCKTANGDVIDLPPSYQPIHAAAKPVDLYKRLLARTCNAGDLALDPTCGSGTIFPAATFLNVNAVGIEKSPDHAKLADARRYLDK